MLDTRAGWTIDDIRPLDGKAGMVMVRAVSPGDDDEHIYLQYASDRVNLPNKPAITNEMIAIVASISGDAAAQALIDSRDALPDENKFSIGDNLNLTLTFKE